MKQQVSPAVIAGVIVVVVIFLGVFYYRQFVVTPPTPRPNKGVDMSSHRASGATTPGQ